MAIHEQQKISILLVDDDQTVSTNLNQFLTKNDYTVSNAYTGVDGLDLAKEQLPDIALIDLKLPDINGIELLKAIHAVSPKTIIILISGYATIDAAAESIRHGAYDFIAKPFNFNELHLTLQRSIEIKTRKERLTRLKKRNLILAVTLPLWALLGYIIISVIK